MQSVLDLDPELGEDLSPDTRRVARAAAVASTLQFDPGELRLRPWLDRVGLGPGLLVMDGVLVSNASVGDRIAAELIGAGDLIAPAGSADDDLLAYGVRWRALVRSKLALLDEAFAKRIRFWPTITAGLLRRSEKRICDLNVQRAVAAQPRLEVRLTLLLWHLSTRWGKVEAGGIRLPLPLTHHLLGRLIAAERPSVSHALARLAHAGLITGHGDEWHLHGSLSDHLDALAERSSSVADAVPLLPR
jgi:CRP-like cAMP-binding protein